MGRATRNPSQGGSVINTFLENPEHSKKYHICAFTHDVNKPDGHGRYNSRVPRSSRVTPMSKNILHVSFKVLTSFRDFYHLYHHFQEREWHIIIIVIIIIIIIIIIIREIDSSVPEFISPVLDNCRQSTGDFQGRRCLVPWWRYKMNQLSLTSTDQNRPREQMGTCRPKFFFPRVRKRGYRGMGVATEKY